MQREARSCTGSSRGSGPAGNRKPSRARTRTRSVNARYETCRECGLDWNVSKQAAIPWSGYLCPVCWSRQRKEAQARESSQSKNAGGRDGILPMTLNGNGYIIEQMEDMTRWYRHLEDEAVAADREAAQQAGKQLTMGEEAAK